MKILFNQLILIMLLLTILSVDVSAQLIDSSQRANNQSTYQQYVKKSHNQKVAGKILTITGSVCLTTGFGLTMAGLNGLFDPNIPEKNYGNAPDILAIGGAALIVAAVPFLLSANANKKKARLYLKNESLLMPGIKSDSRLVSIGLKLRL